MTGVFQPTRYPCDYWRRRPDRDPVWGKHSVPFASICVCHTMPDHGRTHGLNLFIDSPFLTELGGGSLS